MSILQTSTKKYAVVIGINYTGTGSQLSGCINDANNIKNFLVTKCNYSYNDIYMLIDDGVGTRPTKENILKSFDTLVAKATSEGCNELWLSYSGHGSYVSDANGDEADRRDETICPVDYESAGFIIDDLIYSRLAVRLPAGVTLFSLMDCCHSGTIFDLPYIYDTVKKVNNSNSAHKANIISISGCKDTQTSADAFIDNKYAGAMTWSFLTALANAKYDINVLALTNSMRTLLKNNYTQVPMLAVSTESEYNKKIMQIGIFKADPPTKQISFEMTGNLYYANSSWNVWSETKQAMLFPTDKVFTVRNQTVVEKIALEAGKYKVQVKNLQGTGGVITTVKDGVKVLVKGQISGGKKVEYFFTVEI